MDIKISYTDQHPENFNSVWNLYESLGWNSLHLSVEELERMCKQSWYVVYAYDEKRLVGMGRVLSDGVVTAVICGVGVMPSYQSNGIGKDIMTKIIKHCEQQRVISQLMCAESLETYYEKLGFTKFTIGMKGPGGRF